jgi:hypothetical protein
VLLVLLCVAWACASQPVPKHEPLELGQVGLASLSGDWAGTRETKQAGKCSIGERDDKRWQRSQMDSDESVQIVVEADGTITARRHLKEGTLAPRPEWWGSVDDRLLVTAEQDSNAECGGVKSSVMTRLQGQFERGAKGAILELSGLEKTCPGMGCEFKIVYRLTKK